MACDVPRCEECGVPEYISKEHTWLCDGSIVQTRSPETRMAFIESQNWDPIWVSMSEMIGVPIEHIISDVSRRATLGYLLPLVTKEVRDLLREGRFPLEQVFETTFMQVRVSGIADPSLVDVRFEGGPDDFVICRYKTRSPFHSQWGSWRARPKHIRGSKREWLTRWSLLTRWTLRCSNPGTPRSSKEGWRSSATIPEREI